jgi:hypothetical protein
LGDGVDPRGHFYSIANIAYNIMNMNIYSLGVGISIVFEIFSQFPISGGWVDPSTKGHEK